MNEVTVVGGGLAGAEAAWQLAQNGVAVRLCEMRPGISTPAHRTGNLAELVCSNSLRGLSLQNAVGLLKEEMRRLGSLIMAAADATRIPAGGALAVDREDFSVLVTKRLSEHPLVQIVREEVTEVPAPPVLIATGPLTSGRFAGSLREMLGHDYFHFYDAIAPIVYADSLEMDVLFACSRYGKGDDAAYLNAPMNAPEYEDFVRELLSADTRAGDLPEDEVYFEGCLPIEEIARRGPDTLRFGPFKPVGLLDPRIGRRPYAVLQLRRDNASASLFNLVGCQTRMTHGDQARVFRLVPGLRQAEFARLGGMHRNSYIMAPLFLLPTGEMRSRTGVFFAGQLTGVEGYVESAAGGLIAGMNLSRRVLGRDQLILPPETALGALMAYITTADPEHFQPMNINFGLLPAWDGKRLSKRDRYLALSQRALSSLESCPK